MRNISPAALAQILEREGTEPITLIQVFWDIGVYDIFGDRAFVPGIKGQLLDVGEIQNVVNASQGANSGSMSVRLDDHDGRLKEIFNTMDIHKRPVYVLQWFPEIPLNDAFIVFDGVITSPIEWNEGERTLSFEVLSKVEDLEVGFSAEEGNFPYIPPNIVGRAWPLVFGHVDMLPCVQINQSPQGTTSQDVGRDNTGSGQGAISDIHNNEFKNLTLLEELERECFLMAAILLGEGDSIDSSTSRTTDASSGLDGSFTRKSNNPVAQQLYDLGTQYEQKGNEYHAERIRPINGNTNGTGSGNNNGGANNKNVVHINGGSKFPQGSNIVVRINGVAYEGYFEGDIFHISGYTSPFADKKAVAGPTTVIDRAVATEYKTDLAVSNFMYAIAGSNVQVSGSTYPVWYIIGIPALGRVVLFGEKTTTGTQKHMINPAWYTVVQKTFGDLSATFVEFTIPLSTRHDENWSDNIWASCTSGIGPNGVDVLEYIIENYTNQSVDEASFSLVRPLVAPYKVGFALTERRGAMQVLEEISYQLRCAIWFKGGRFYLKYLPKREDPVDTITEDDVESGTMQVFGNDSEDLVTKWTINWRDELDKSSPNRVIYRYHIRKYGLISANYDCYIFNTRLAVCKFAQFWLIRKANTWKKIKFSTFMSKLRLEPFDPVLIDFTHPWVNDPGCVNPTIGIVEEAAYDSNTQRIQLTIWLPIRFGEMCPYDFAYPSNLDTTFVFPIEGDPGTITDVPGASANSVLYDQSPHTGPNGTPQTTPPNSGSGGDTAPGDSQDATHPGYEPPTALDPSQITNSGSDSQATTVSQRVIKPINIVALDVPDATYPGIIGEFEKFDDSERQVYKVDVYINGLNKEPVSYSVTQLLMDAADTIPKGTPALVVRNCQRTSDKLITGVNYTMQVPIWLKPIDPKKSDAVPDGAPQSDQGTPPTDGDGQSGDTTDEGDGGDE